VIKDYIRLDIYRFCPKTFSRQCLIYPLTTPTLCLLQNALIP
jgi:hypothetical protein